MDLQIATTPSKAKSQSFQSLFRVKRQLPDYCICQPLQITCKNLGKFKINFILKVCPARQDPLELPVRMEGRAKVDAQGREANQAYQASLLLEILIFKFIF